MQRRHLYEKQDWFCKEYVAESEKKGEDNTGGKKIRIILLITLGDLSILNF